MHVDVTTTVSIKDDDGKEIARVSSKDRTSFSSDDEASLVHRKVARALDRAKRLVMDYPDSVIASLNRPSGT